MARWRAVHVVVGLLALFALVFAPGTDGPSAEAAPVGELTASVLAPTVEVGLTASTAQPDRSLLVGVLVVALLLVAATPTAIGGMARRRTPLVLHPVVGTPHRRRGPPSRAT